MVFQDAVLYPFMTARDNVAFPLHLQHRPAAEVELRVSAEGRALGIERLFDARPAELSAGHRQLVQIGRAMVRAPAVLLLDEPLAMVDAQARAAMRAEMRTLQQGYGVTALYVTNDPVEAMAMGDRVAVMERGPDRPDRVADRGVRRPRLGGGGRGDRRDRPARRRGRRRPARLPHRRRRPPAQGVGGEPGRPRGNHGYARYQARGRPGGWRPRRG